MFRYVYPSSVILSVKFHFSRKERFYDIFVAGNNETCWGLHVLWPVFKFDCNHTWIFLTIITKVCNYTPLLPVGRELIYAEGRNDRCAENNKCLSQLMRKTLRKVIWLLYKKIQSLCYSCKSFCLYFKRGKTPRIEEKKMCVSRSTATKHMNLFFMTNRFFDLWRSVIARDKYRLWLGLRSLTNFIICCWSNTITCFA